MAVPLNRLLLTALLWSAAASGQAQKEAIRIPPHPNRLQFPVRSVQIPAADDLTYRLSSGTRVVIVEDHTLPLVDVVVAIRAGSYLDPDDRPGLAEMTAAMMRRGGTAEMDADTFDDAIDFLGAEIDARASGTRAGASLDCLADTLEESLGLLFAMLERPAFQADRLRGIKSNLLAGFAARSDDPIAVMEREWWWLLMGTGHHLSRQLTSRDIERLSQQDLADFQARFWRPESAVIAVSGDVQTARVLELLETHVEHWRQSAMSDPPQPVPWPPRAAEQPKQPALFVVEHVSPQAKVSIGERIPAIPDWLSTEATALEIANEILGGTTGLVSRINGRLRGKGWVYRALSEVDIGRYEEGSFRIFLDASPENVVPAIGLCLGEIDRIRSQPADQRELELVQEEFLSALARRFDSAKETAGYFAEDLLLKRPHEYWYGFADRVRNVEPRHVQAAARRYFKPDDLTVLIVGGEGGPRLDAGGDRRLTRRLPALRHLPPRDPLSLEPLEPSAPHADPG